MNKIIMMMTAAILVLPASAFAVADVTVSIQAEKVVMVEKDGKKVEKLVEAKDAVPGDVLVYTLVYKNKGDESAKNVLLNDPIPSGTSYITDSAYGPATDITFSIDNGKSYKKPSLLSYEVKAAGKTEKRTASPDLYTNIRWTVKEVPAGKSGVASFRVRVQ